MCKLRLDITDKSPSSMKRLRRYFLAVFLMLQNCSSSFSSSSCLHPPSFSPPSASSKTSKYPSGLLYRKGFWVLLLYLYCIHTGSSVSCFLRFVVPDVFDRRIFEQYLGTEQNLHLFRAYLLFTDNFPSRSVRQNFFIILKTMSLIL